ncbi:MAG: hypothetical protein KY467_03950 [Gemmatimonadetes bacterium]|nr:hypothetical protein [Gemmatimonadota bacterium]
MRVILVAGAWPNFMKVAPVLASLRRAGHRPVPVRHRQRYGVRMPDAFLAGFELPERWTGGTARRGSVAAAPAGALDGGFNGEKPNER